MKNTFKEVLHKGLKQEIVVKRFLVNKKSKFQRIQIFDTEIYGRVLALDGIIQITEKDEASYSEMLVHPPMQVMQDVKNILKV